MELFHAKNQRQKFLPPVRVNSSLPNIDVGWVLGCQTKYSVGTEDFVLCAIAYLKRAIAFLLTVQGFF